MNITIPIILLEKNGEEFVPFFFKVLNAYLALEEPFFYEVWNLEIFIRG